MRFVGDGLVKKDTLYVCAIVDCVPRGQMRCRLIRGGGVAEG